MLAKAFDSDFIKLLVMAGAISVGSGVGNFVGHGETRSDAEIREICRTVIKTDSPWLADKPHIQAKLDEILKEVKGLREARRITK